MAKAPAPRKPTTAENLQATLNNPNVRKFLDMLSAMEGTTTHGYNTTFGGGRVESLDRHPNIQREFRQTDGTTNSSGAFGRYQFMPDTWAGLRRQYPEQTKDMSQKAQDFGAVALIANRGALNDVVSGRFGTAVRKVGAEWASLPTSPYKQPKKSWDDVNRALGLQVPATAVGGAKAANAQALTPEQGKKLYDVYKAGRMSPEQRADYERDFATIQKPAGATMLRAAAAPTGGSGGSGGAPVAAATPAQAAQATAKTAPYVLPVEIIMAYNDGSMNPQQRSEFERDYKAGVIAAPRHIPFKLQESEVPIDQRDYTGNRTGQFLDQSGQALGNFGKAVLGDGVIDAATAIPRAALGGAQALIQGAGSMGVEAIAGLSGLGAGAQAALTGGDGLDTAVNQIEYARNLMQPLIPQPVVAPQTTAAAGGVLAIPMYGTQAGGQASFDERGNPLAATVLQASGDALLMTLGLGRVGKPTVPTARAMPTDYVPTQQFTSPNPLQAARIAGQARNPVAQAAAASMGREIPIPVQQVREDTPSAEPLTTNPAEAVPRPDVAPRPAATGRTELTPENPTVTIQPNGTPAPAGVVNPVLDGTYISSRTGKPYETAEAAQNGLAAGRLEATHEVSAIDGGYGLTPKRNAATPDPITDPSPTGRPITEPAAAGTITTVGEGGLNVMHGSTRADLTADQIQVVNPNSKQGKRGRVYGGFYATTDAASAQRYADMGGEGSVPTVYDVQIKPGAKILDIEGIEGITRLTPATIERYRADGIDVVRGKDPRKQVEYAIINPEAVGALTPRAKPASSSVASIPAPNRQTASDITNGFNAIAIAAESASRSDVGRNITTGKADRLTMYKPEAIAAAESNPNYNTSRNPDGSVTIIGVKTDESGWIGVEPRTQPTATPTARPIRRPEGKAFTTSQKPVAFEYDVVPIESVVKSTNADLTPNAAARPELQPRNRDTDASTAQINTITNLLNPEWLAESPKFSDGAPTVFGSEAVAGHGRLAAIERRYAQGVGDEYRNFITQKATELGIDPARLAGIERPVLVRRIKDEADALTIAQDSNAPTTLRMTPAEQARIDAPNLPALDKLVRGEDGEMNIPASYDFVRDFMGKLPVAERGDLMTADGRISQAAVRRIQAAVAEKAYKDPDLIARFTESMGDEGKRISAALQKQAGAVAALAEAAAKGERYPTTLGADLAQAANKYADIKAAGSTVREYLDQDQLVDDGLSVGAREALEVMGENAKSGRAVGEYIQSKIAEVEAKGNPMQDSLFQRSRISKTVDDLIDDLASFLEKDDDFLFDNYEIREGIIDSLVKATLKDDGFSGLALPNGSGTVMVTPSAKKAGAWQVTQFDRKMRPNGDNGTQTKAAALRDFFEQAQPVRSKTEDSLFQSSRAQKEAEAVRKQYEGTPEWMQAPNGRPTKLDEQQWVQVRTPSFKEWFGDWENNPKGASKVVDENGEPLVVYHGTDRTFESFRAERGVQTAFFARSKELAEQYAKGRSKRSGLDEQTYAVYLKSKNPMIVDANGAAWDYIAIGGIENSPPAIRFFEKRGQEFIITEMAAKKSFELGFDGLVVKNVMDGFGYGKAPLGTIYGIASPTQIKSATANAGAFDGANPNIYMQANKPQAAAIGERIAEQVKAAGRSADEAKQAGKLAEAYYAATAKALGLTPDEVFAQVGLSVGRGDVGGANAALRLGEREHAMVFGENANASSFVHEAGHHFLETHAKLADESPKIQADVDAVMTWAGHDGRAWSDLSASQKREVHEKFAESFEQYLLTGKPPTKGLKGVFENFKQWLTDVYTSLAEFAATNPRADLSPEVMAVMDRMLGGNKAEKAANSARGKGRKKSAPITDELLDFKRSAPVSGGVSPALHQSRYDVLRDIGLTDEQIRGGSVEGDLKRLEWDAELAKYDTDYGVKMKEQLELERQKLREYGDGVVDSMGGTPKATPETRGAAIVRPLEAYQAWYQDKIKAFYKLADEQGAMTGGIELRGLEAKLKENSAFYNDALLSMRKSLKSFMLEQRLLDSKGNPKPMSAKQAEMVRKHLNSIRTFETSRVIGELNALIDDAVFSTLNRSVYGEARAVNTQYHRIFSDPKGIARLLDVDGINRKISHENVAANVAALAETDAAQFRHIMKQLEDMPTPELQKMADQAIGEIRAHIAEKITAYDSTKPETVAAIGKALAPYRGGKLREIFGEKGAQKLETFVAAHGILRKVDAQPSGTSSMTRNVIMKLAEAGTAMVGGSAGLATGGAYGAAAGTLIGQQIGARIKGSMVAAVDKKSYGKAMSPRQLETMRQSYDASGRRLAALPETEAATTAAQAAPDSTRARVTNARLERTKQWIEFHSKLTDEQKAAVKKIGAAAWLLSVSGLGDNQTNDDGENR